MVDITKCSGVRGNDVCPMRDKCYRYTAKVGFMQSYLLTPPFEVKELIECDMFLRQSLWNDLNDIVR